MVVDFTSTLGAAMPDDALRIVASGEREDGTREDNVPYRDQAPMLPR